MIGLVIDTSSAAVTAGVIAVRDDGAVEVLAETVTVDARAHAELLADHVRSSVRSAAIGFAEVSAVVVGVGPGPYTGLRVGVASGAAFADALDVVSYGVVSLDAIGLGAWTDRFQGSHDMVVATDARRREVYWARYRSGRRDGELSVGKPADVADALALDPPAALAGAGAAMYAETLALRAPGHDGALVPLIDVRYPRVESLGRLAAARMLAGAPGETLSPLYLRRPDAEAPTSIKAVLPR